MGCQAVTPHLVGLARRLEGKPFHLIATHCQQGKQEDVVGYVRTKGLAPDTQNTTVSSMGGHPKVKGKGYVPYYMVFDHTGKLAHHHMCGAYHGGDGLKMIEWVDDLHEKTPAISLGDEPFDQFQADPAEAHDDDVVLALPHAPPLSLEDEQLGRRPSQCVDGGDGGQHPGDLQDYRR